jgi:hypothetical protein
MRLLANGMALGRCALAAALGVATAACAPAVAGEWTSPDSASYYQNGTVYAPNHMTVGSDGTGKAEVSYLLNADPLQLVHVDRFEIDWSEEGSSAFGLAMSCFESDVESPCSSHDFAMRCDVGSGESGSQASSLSCTGDGMWTDYLFEWQAVVSE